MSQITLQTNPPRPASSKPMWALGVVARGAILTTLTLVGLVAGLWCDRIGRTDLARFAYGLTYLAGGIPISWLALRRLFTDAKLDINLLMVVAALGAAYIGHADEGAVLLFLFTLSNTLQDWAMMRTSDAIRALEALSPSTATVQLPDGHEITVPIDALRPGDHLRVRPGERFPADAVVLEGFSSVDESAITGESVPVDRGVNDVVRSGTLNGSGVLLVRVERPAGESTLAKLVRMVEAAQAAKGPTERFADRFEGPYTVFVLLATPVVFVVLHFALGFSSETALYRAMTFLVVASPCAVVIATPAAMLSAMGAGARAGVLFKGGDALEALARVTVLAFDKTGTLTEGQMRLVAVRSLTDHNETQALALAAGLERHSEHPIAQAISESASGEVVALEHVQGLRGRGVIGHLIREEDRAQFGGSLAWVGTRRLAIERGVQVSDRLEIELNTLEHQGLTTMILGCDERALAVLGVADTPRTQAHAAIAQLEHMGIRTVMLTGDRSVVAAQIANQLGVQEVRAELLPEHKLEAIAALGTEGMVGMVGDGVNDAPALAAASVGISMGSGSDVALESADVVLTRNDLFRLVGAIRLARATMQTVRFNLTVAMGVIVVVGVLSLVGVVPLPVGVIAHEGGTVFVCLVGLRLLAHPVRA